MRKVAIMLVWTLISLATASILLVEFAMADILPKKEGNKPYYKIRSIIDTTSLQ